MTSYEDIPGWFSTHCAAWYRQRVKEAPPAAHFVEVGCWQGRSAAAMAEAIRDLGPRGTRFDCIDHWTGTDPAWDNGYHTRLLEELGKPLDKVFEGSLRLLGLWPYVNQLTGDSSESAARYEDQSLDLVFIDADHSPEAVERDIRAWLPKLRPGGMIAGHDAQGPGVIRALTRVFGGAHQVDREIWWYRMPAARREPVAVEYPTHWGTGDKWRPWIVRGFESAGIQASPADRLVSESYFLRGAWDGHSPMHIAALDVIEGGSRRRVWYDYSDFRKCFCGFNHHMFDPDDSYFKIQWNEHGEHLLTGHCRALPIGQGVGRADEYLEILPGLRKLAQEVPQHDITAMFANTDKSGLRERAVRQLQDHGFAGHVGLWRFNAGRPEPHPSIAAPRLSPGDHWRLQACSLACVALPGVEGDWTWRHTEVLGIGRPLVTLETDQGMPGNWRGCWLECARDLSDLSKRVEALIDDEQESARLGRLGRWYYERNLKPSRMAERIIGGVA